MRYYLGLPIYVVGATLAAAGMILIAAAHAISGSEDEDPYGQIKPTP